MPLPKDVVRQLASGELGAECLPVPGYIEIIPTLGPDVFPDEVTIRSISQSGGEEGRVLHALLRRAGLTKGQRAAITHLLGFFSMIGENKITVGDIRALTSDELMRLRKKFSWGTPSMGSVEKIKKLFG